MFLSRAIIFLIKLYQLILSPFLGKTCRFNPSCSNYATESIEKHGAIQGMFFSIKRILRCNPWGGHGFDPVKD